MVVRAACSLGRRFKEACAGEEEVEGGWGLEIIYIWRLSLSSASDTLFSELIVLHPLRLILQGSFISSSLLDSDETKHPTCPLH
jgi:hypothetical protein